MPATSTSLPAEPDAPEVPLRTIAAVVAATVALGLLGCMGLGTLGDHLWIFDLFNHFYVQYAAIALALGIASAVLRARVALALFTVALGVALAQLAPLVLSPGTSGPSQSDAATARLRIVAQNVRTANQQYAKTTDWLLAQNADVLVLQETGQRWVDELDAVLTSYRRLETDTIRDDNFGISVYAKSDLGIGAIEVLGAPASVPWIDVEIVRGTRSIHLIAIHTIPPMSSGSSESRNTHLSALAARVSTIEGPVAVAGDLNATPWSRSLRPILQGTDLRPACYGHGVQGSWPSSLWFTGMILIDHVLVSDEIRVESHGVGQDVGSDHRGVVADIAF